MKKHLASTLILTLCFLIAACTQQTPEKETQAAPETQLQITTTDSNQPILAEETEPISYTYTVESMQNADCVYYKPDAVIPNSSDPSSAQGKIKVWTQCPNCGKENIGTYTINPETLDFSSGDTIMHSGSDSCWDCSWDADMDQFMWTIRITRIAG